MAFQPTRGAPKTLRELYLWAWNNFSRVSRAGAEGDHSGLINRELAGQHPISAITDLQAALDNKSSIGYASVVGAGAIGAGLDIGVWEIVPLTAQPVASPVGASINLGANTFTIDVNGVWMLAFTGTVRHTASAAATQRAILARIFNVTSGAPVGPALPFAAARDAASTTLAYQLMLDVTVPGNAYRVELSAEGAAFSNVIVERLNLSISRYDSG